MTPELKENRCPSCSATIHIPHNARTVVCEHCGNEFTLETTDSPTIELASLDGEIITLLQQGKYIDAVKLVRDNTNQGLKESRDYVGEVAERYNIDISAKGCSSTAVITGVIIAVLIVIVVLIIMVFS